MCRKTSTHTNFEMNFIKLSTVTRSGLLYFMFEVEWFEKQAAQPEPVLAARHPLLSKLRPTRTNVVMASLPRSSMF